MSTTRQKAFLAYPGQDALIAETLAEAHRLSRDETIEIIPWQKIEPFGLKIDDLIRERIDDAELLIADITNPNFNVYYEIGYAMAQKKPVLLTVYAGADKGPENARFTGLFDNIGYSTYQNTAELIIQVKNWPKRSWIEKYTKSKDHAQPLFILDLYTKSNFRQYIFEAVRARSVNFRTFDPFERPNLPAALAIAEVSASSGCILPLIRENERDFRKHNLRCAFLAGCCHGLGIDPLIIQYDNSPAPLDYRDFISNTKGQSETHSHVEDYCGSVLIRNQKSSNRETNLPKSLLSKIDIGSASAENETESLAEYFVETAEFKRAERSDHALIVGRKGSGKTAILSQLKHTYTRNRNNAIVELRPATHNLSELREQLIGVVNQGVFDHTMAAFWQSIIYMEILLELRDRLLSKAKRDFDLLKKIQNIEEKFNLTSAFVAADFTSRLTDAISSLIYAIRKDKAIGVESLTNVLFQHNIPNLRDAVCELEDEFQDVVLLFDDLDKGWPPRQLENHDIMMIRHLVESLRKIERDLKKKDINFKAMLFLRSDVYENLVEVTSDRNKQIVIKVDWTDSHHLINLIKRRVLNGFAQEDHERVWQAFNPVLKDGRFAMDHLTVGALYRPRFLIELCEMMLASAINRGAAFVDENDVESALKQFSRYLVSEWGLELRDVSGIPRDIFYYFIGKPELLTSAEIENIVRPLDMDITTENLINLLLWYGFLGLADSDNKKIYIFDCEYDFRRLEVNLSSHSETLFCVNYAFLRGLEMY